MSRNSSGTYSLPASYNPVVTNTQITTTWANTTLSDIATAITDSLDRQGRGSMLAALKIVDGSAAAPGLSFGSESTSGLYRVATNVLGLAIGGAQSASFHPGVVAARGAAGTAAYLSAAGNGAAVGSGSFDFQQGAAGAAQIINRANSSMSFYNNGIELMRLNAGGQLGVGRTATTYGIEVQGSLGAYSGGVVSFYGAQACGNATNHVFGFYTNSIERLQITADGAVIPLLSGAYNLGLSTNRWASIQAVVANFSSDLAVGGNGSIAGTLAVTGGLTASINAGAGLSGTAYNGSTARTFSIATNSNGYGVRTVSTSAASGVPSDGDIWYQREA